MNMSGLLDIPSWHGEDFDDTWGFLDVEGKVVLDLGADYGSTAAFFLNKGAVKVICVESYENDYGRLAILARSNPRIEAFENHLSDAGDFEKYVGLYQPDVCKIDVEGAEAHLLNVRPCVLRRVGQFGIEIHNLANSIQCNNPRPLAYANVNDLQPHFENLFRKTGHVVEAMHKGNWVLYARKP